MNVGRLGTLDFTVGLLAILLVLEATRRAVGLTYYGYCHSICSLWTFWTIYAWVLITSWSNFERMVQTMFFSTEGILGTPLAISSTFIFLFLLFGSFLIRTGVGQYFNDLSTAIAGRRSRRACEGCHFFKCIFKERSAEAL